MAPLVTEGKESDTLERRSLLVDPTHAMAGEFARESRSGTGDAGGQHDSASEERPFGLPPWKKSRLDERHEAHLGSEFADQLHSLQTERELPHGLPCVTFTMDGAGVLGAFHNGVARYLQEYLSIDSHLVKFCGTSSGAAVAAALVANVDMHTYFSHAKTCVLKTFSNPFKLCSNVRKCLENTLPPKEEEKALLERVNGRFFPSLSVRVACCGCQPEPVTEFDSREDFIGAVRASCHLPLLGGLRGYKVRGRRYYDGGLSQKFALFPSALAGREGNIVIRITPWASIKPGWIASGLRFSRGWTYRPRDEQTMDKLFHLGYYRAKEFFVKLKEEGTIHVLEHIIRKTDEDSLQSVHDNIEELVQWFKRKYPGMDGSPEHYQRWDEWVLHPTNWRKPQWNPMVAMRNIGFNLRSGRRPEQKSKNGGSTAESDWAF